MKKMRYGAGYKIMSSAEAMKRLDEVDGLARKHHQAKKAETRKRLADELFGKIHNDKSLLTGELSPVAALAHNTIRRRGRWDDPVQTALDIAQEFALKLGKKERKWPAKLPFKALAGRIIVCTSLDVIKRHYRHYNKRKHDGVGPASLEPSDILASVIDPNAISPHAYDRLYEGVLAQIQLMPPLERSVAMQRIMDLEILNGREFALLHERSSAWASDMYTGVTKNMRIKLYVLALELGIAL